MGRVAALGLDIGRKRVGVAGCDGTGLIATELTTLKRKAYPEFVADLRAIVEARQVEILVIGLPYSMDGSIGHQAQQVQKLAQRLSASLELPIEYVDERLTSYEAELLIQANSRSRDRNQRQTVQLMPQLFAKRKRIWRPGRRVSHVNPRRLGMPRNRQPSPLIQRPQRQRQRKAIALIDLLHPRWQPVPAQLRTGRHQSCEINRLHDSPPVKQHSNRAQF